MYLLLLPFFLWSLCLCFFLEDLDLDLYDAGDLDLELKDACINLSILSYASLNLTIPGGRWLLLAVLSPLTFIREYIIMEGWDHSKS